MIKWLTDNRKKLINDLSNKYMIPSGVIIAWIEVESGGNIKEVTSLNERGLLQLMEEESKTLHADHLRLSEDDAYSLEVGCQYITQRKNELVLFIHKYNLPIELYSEYFWKCVKYLHSIGVYGGEVILRSAGQANFAESWESFATYCNSRDKYFLHLIKHSPLKWAIFVNTMFVFAIKEGFPVQNVPPKEPPPKPTVQILFDAIKKFISK